MTLVLPRRKFLTASAAVAAIAAPTIPRAQIFNPPMFMPKPSGGAWAGPTSTLTHRWQMDSGSIGSGVVHDLVGSLDATIVGSPTNVSSPAGAFASTGLSFNGSADQLNLASSPVTLGSDLTVAFWINLPDITFIPDGAGTDPRFFNWAAVDWMMVSNLSGAGASGQLNFATSYSTGKNTSGVVLSNNTWAHLAFTLSSGAVTIYVNGSSTGLTTSSGDTGTASANRIACRGDDVRHTKGAFYQFVTYSSALSAGNVTTLYNAK